MIESWAKIYGEKKFSIATILPSKIVAKGFEMLRINTDFRVLDLGCGNGRNSIYAAEIGGMVNSVDIENLGFTENISNDIKDRINFQKMSVMDFEISKETYDCIIATRLLQYLEISEVDILLNRIKNGLTKDGLLILNYTASGGILDNIDINIHKYMHSINDILNALTISDLDVISLEEGLKVSSSVPYTIPNETYEIIAKRR